MLETNNQNVHKLIIQAKEGNQEAQESLYKLYIVPIYRYIFLRVKHKQTAEDLSQTVFLKIFNSLTSFINSRSSPLPYFYTIARNTVIDFVRSKRGSNVEDPEEVFATLTDSKEGPHAEVERKQSISSIHDLINYLEGQQQEVIVLKFVNDLSNKEIADLMGKSEEAIRQLQCRAIKTLRKIIKEKRVI